jgi:hydroxyacylglutathione hydrolase
MQSLKQRFDCAIIGPEDSRLGSVDSVMRDEERLEIEGTTIRCLETPGHTRTSVCYFMTSESMKTPALFTGDTMFVCGCGRIFECDGQTMYASLQKLAALPYETQIYPGHDYTEENVTFALMYEPENKILKEKLKDIRHKTAQNKPTIPSILGDEKQLNPFLNAPDWKQFARLRKEKDLF